VLSFLWLVFQRFKDNFEIFLKYYLLTSKIFSDSSRDLELFFYQTQMTNSSCATYSENRTHIDFSVRQTNSIVLSSHKFFHNSTIIDLIFDDWTLFEDLCICESSRVFELDSLKQNAFLKLIVSDKSFSNFWDKWDWIDQLTSI
jgi:acyl-CoA synthetase (AMP-forming)/AMP-acid ligase II